MKETQDKLKNIICEYVDVAPEELDANTNLKFDIGLDSFGMISLICAIESEFNVEITGAACASFNTLSDMVEFIQSENKKKAIV